MRYEGKGGAQGKWRKSEIVGALIFLFHMRGGTFEPSNMPRTVIAEMLGVNRHRITRCIGDAKRSMDLAVLLNRRLQEHDKLPKPKMGRPVATEEKRVENVRDQGFKTKGKRNRNMSMRPMREAHGNQSQNGA